MEHLQKRGYKHSQIQREIKKAKLVPRDQAVQLSRLKQKLHQGIPFVVTYNPASQSLNKIITKHLSIFQSSNRWRDVFPDDPFIAYWRPRNFRDFLVKAKLRHKETTATSPPTIKKCNSKACNTCTFSQILTADANRRFCSLNHSVLWIDNNEQ